MDDGTVQEETSATNWWSVVCRKSTGEGQFDNLVAKSPDVQAQYHCDDENLKAATKLWTCFARYAAFVD